MPGTVVKMSPRDYQRWLRDLGPRLPVALRRGCFSGALRCIPLMQERTRHAPAANPGGMGDGGAVNTVAYLMRWRATALPNGASVFNSSPYAGIIDGGRRPGTMPPLKAIAKWAQRKLQLSEKEAKAAAYPIALAIKRRGLRPRKVMSDGVDEMVTLVEAEIGRELTAELQR